MGKKVFITGASGSMGGCAMHEIMKSDMDFDIRILLRDKPANRALKKALDKMYDGKIEIMFGDIGNYEDCVKAVDGVDYVLHCAAIIPPVSDHKPKMAEKANYYGTVNLVNAIKASPRADEIKYVHTGTVAEYGNRTWQHPWGRVGDPLVPSCYDFYAVTKLRAERYVLEAELPNWVSLRQSGILHDNLFKNNMADGLMFHTCWNVPIEWATSRDSGLLLRHLIEYDANGTLAEKEEKLGQKFWKHCYNIGNGESCRVTGYNTIDDGFALMGAHAEDFFKPNWNVDRNFHCFWYYDSDLLNDFLDFRTETWQTFWKRMAKQNWYFKLGVLAPKSLISKFAIQRLFKNSNSPKYWIEHNIDGRIKAFYGSRERIDEIGEDWSKYPLFCRNQIKDENGNVVDYEYRRDIKNAKQFLLSHGYDESKPDSELDIEDMRQAAAFRGGKCLSETMVKGDLYTKLKWQCHDGHVFESSPYTVLKAGFWCPECCQPAPWNFDELSRHIPFFAQVWYDTNSPEEHNFLPADCYKDILEESEK